MTHKVMGGSTLAWLAGLASMAAATMALNAVPLDVDSFNGKRVMFITAHPDDIEGFAGGLVATLGLDANRSVEIACVRNMRIVLGCITQQQRSAKPGLLVAA